MIIRFLFAYITTIILILFSLIVSLGFNNLNLWSYFDPSIILTLIGASIFTLVNFKISDILSLIKALISNKEIDSNFLESKKAIINTFWKNIISFSFIIFIMIIILSFGNLDTSKLGPRIAITLIAPLYCLIIKLFIVLPIETALDKKIILLKK